MRFFLDENFPKAAMSLLVSEGHEVYDVRGTPNEGMTDDQIFSMAQKRRAVFLTTDKDFFHTIPRFNPTHHGVVVITLRRPNRSSILDRLTWFLKRVDGVEIAGKTFLLRDRTWTVYPSFHDE